MVTKSQESLFEFVRVSMGAPIILVHLTDDMLCSVMNYVVNEYQKVSNQYLITVQWAQNYGKSIVNQNEVAWNMTYRNMDYSKQFSWWFSKEIGAQSTGPWELKKDFFMIEHGKQDYLIPSGRMINSVLYVTPSTVDSALYAQGGGFFGLGVAGIAGSAGWNGMGGFGGAYGGMFVMPAYDTTLLASDLKYKQHLLGGDLAYKVTAGPDNTHIIHLLSTPGSKYGFTHSGRRNGILGLQGCSVWYTYYDTAQDDAEDCAMYNKDTVLLTPDQFPLSATTYDLMNSQAQTTIQTLLLARAKQIEGYIRGYNSGKVPIPNSTLDMDYNMLISDGKAEWDKTIEDLIKWLETLTPTKQLENQASQIKSMYEILGAVPMDIQIH
jgi:hypothetical protein